MEPFHNFPIGQEQLERRPPPRPQRAELSNAARARPNQPRIVFGYQQPTRFISVDADDFADIVQRLTGLPPSQATPSTTMTANVEPLYHGTRMAPTMQNVPWGWERYSSLDGLRQAHQAQREPPRGPPLQEVLFPLWGQQAHSEPPHRPSFQEVLYPPRGQAEFSQEFPYVLPRMPVNLPGVGMETFPSPMDMQNFEFCQEFAGPSTSRVLRPNTNAPRAWLSDPQPASVPPFPPPRGQAVLSQEFPYVLPRMPVNLPGVGMETFPSPLDMQNFEFFQEFADPSTSMVLRPNTNAPSARLSAPQPASVPPFSPPRGQAEFSEELPHGLPRVPVNLPGVGMETFPSPMDMQNFEFFQEFAGPSTSTVLRPNTNTPRAWLSATQPASVPPFPPPRGQAEFSQEFPHGLPRMPVNLPGGGMETFPSPMDMQNFEFFQEFAGPSTSRVLRPNTNAPRAWLSATQPASAPPFPPYTRRRRDRSFLIRAFFSGPTGCFSAPASPSPSYTQDDPSLIIPTFSSGTRRSFSAPATPSGPAFSWGTRRSFSAPATPSGPAFSS